MRRGSSRRLMAEPNSVGMALCSDAGVRGGARGRMRAERGRGRLDGGDDVLVAGAAAVVAFDSVADLGLRRIGMRREEVHRGHDHAGGTESALQAVLLPEPLLQ